MNLKQFKDYFFIELLNKYPKTEVQSFFNLLIEFTLKISRVDVALQPDLKLSTKHLDYLNSALNKLKKHQPIQYIIGETEFYGLSFKVSNAVLIPRPETEELVDWILEDFKNTPAIKILDIGTGSGCIPISLAKHLPTSKVSAIDISKEALKIANKNATLNNVHINFIEADILQLHSLTNIHTHKTKQSVHKNEAFSKFDIIVSNPPYVRMLEKKQMQANVLENEPDIALFVNDENPLLFYDKIADLALLHLNKNGCLYLEINQYLGNETVNLLKSKGFKTITLKKDLYGADRMVKCSF